MSDMLCTELTTYLLSKTTKPCRQCEELTNQIDIYSETYFCSDDCVSKWNQQYVHPVEEESLCQ